MHRLYTPTRLPLFLLLALILGVATLSAPTPAFAAQPTDGHKDQTAIHDGIPSDTPCWQQPNEFNCDGVDPMQSGCYGLGTNEQLGPVYAVNVAPYFGVQAQMMQRYITWCHTRWTRLFMPSGVSGGPFCFQIEIDRQLMDPLQQWNPSPTGYTCINSGDTIWTNMVWAPWPNNTYPNGYVVSLGCAPNVSCTVTPRL